MNGAARRARARRPSRARASPSAPAPWRALLERRARRGRGARGLPEPLLAGLARAAAGEPRAGALRGAPPRPARARRGARRGLARAARRRARRRAPSPRRRRDLEAFLDAMRLLRREEMLLAACLDFGGASRLRGRLAPPLVAGRGDRAALAARRAALAARAARRCSRVVAMGKLGGREFTYHSDLDLIFLYGGGVDAVHAASRIAQRLISYVSDDDRRGLRLRGRLAPATVGEAGHAGDLLRRLRGLPERATPRPGSTSRSLRARPIAGARARRRGRARAACRRAPSAAAARRWAEVADMRRRIEARARRARGAARSS